jgi:nicotinamidase-related amidase
VSKNEALLIIDYTNDFVHDKGALTAGAPAQKLEGPIVRLAERIKQAGGWVILPTDVHRPNDPYHPESRLFPAHNVRGTWGRKLYGRLADWFAENKSSDHVWLMDKTRYSAFAGTDLDLRLRERRVDTLHLVGVDSDICVLHTAVDAYDRDYRLIIHRAAVATPDPAGQKWALNHFKSVLGAELVD